MEQALPGRVRVRAAVWGVAKVWQGNVREEAQEETAFARVAGKHPLIKPGLPVLKYNAPNVAQQC